MAAQKKVKAAKEAMAVLDWLLSNPTVAEKESCVAAELHNPKMKKQFFNRYGPTSATKLCNIHARRLS